eukprot:TRINITY_DN1525_c1_g2_i1.p4 TRINITY_DN1525_c1_g2~~TRINITY_DN1525_c1_g2_i1.p4  ORF type:complete len:149 (-),score=3.83 TRINITY_DN1525_c1_g2_i1:1118-1537(-)
MRTTLCCFRFSFLLFLYLTLVTVVMSQESVPLGGIQRIDLDSADDFTYNTVNSTAQFAVEQINAKLSNGTLEFENASPSVPLELTDIIEASQQVVSGVLYYITFGAIDSNETEYTFSTTVWEQAWRPDPREMTSVQLLE